MGVLFLIHDLLNFISKLLDFDETDFRQIVLSYETSFESAAAISAAPKRFIIADYEE